MAYSVTDKKRIRKSFAARQKILDVPYVLAIQKVSYAQFLQKDVPSKKRKDQGLQAAFHSVLSASHCRHPGILVFVGEGFLA